MATVAAEPIELARLRKMMLIRQFENRVYTEYCAVSLRNPDGSGRLQIGGFVHLSTGQ
jgi:hypothetical protein